MKPSMVRHQAKVDRADENQALIEAVFDDLEERQPEGFTYMAFWSRTPLFVHVVVEHDVDAPKFYFFFFMFQAFVADIADWCDVPPLAMGASIVGGYR